EVRGLAEDWNECDVILSEEDVAQMWERPRYGVIAQTTQPIERVLQLVLLMRRRFPSSEVRFVDTVCQPTKLRQVAAIEIALQSDVVVVVGGKNSNNTRELAGTCARYCSRVHQIQTAAELRREWFEGAETVGITAGTSSPDALTQEVEEWLRHFDQQTPADNQPALAAPERMESRELLTMA
ncbi:MAG: 4-hydroxy-3-methylbut-2-enyl diphosphate reductase, partial [Verrucomicrobia bacterium]|nr:4-hydroxy-3-methylbut-2-enyl diphosphate reductase [Verrucomicrobiota bacterium]